MLGRGRGRTYKVKVESLLKELQKNRAEHAEIVEKARGVFRERVVKELDAMLQLAKSGGEIKTKVNLTIPQDHTETFDNAIGLLELTLDAGETVIEIDASEYERFVRNNWDWTPSFRASTQAYTG